MKTTTNFALARVREAREEYRRAFPKVLYSLAALLAGVTMLSGGTALLVSSNYSNEQESGYVSYIDDDLINDNNYLNNINVNATYQNRDNDPKYVGGIILETFGGIAGLVGLIALYRSIKDISKEKRLYYSDIDMICKLFVYDNEFNLFLHNFGLEKEKFLELNFEDRLEIIDGFIDAYDKEMAASNGMQK